MISRERNCFGKRFYLFIYLCIFFGALNITSRVPSSVTVFKGRQTATRTNTIYSKLINSPTDKKGKYARLILRWPDLLIDSSKNICFFWVWCSSTFQASWAVNHLFGTFHRFITADSIVIGCERDTLRYIATWAQEHSVTAVGKYILFVFHSGEMKKAQRHRWLKWNNKRICLQHSAVPR